VKEAAQHLRTLGLTITSPIAVKELRTKLKSLEGFMIQGTIRAEERFEQESQTDEQLAAGEERKDLLGPDGKPISAGWTINFKQPVGRAIAMQK
jgi:hypothetical protein